MVAVAGISGVLKTRSDTPGAKFAQHSTAVEVEDDPATLASPRRASTSSTLSQAFISPRVRGRSFAGGYLSHRRLALSRPPQDGSGFLCRASAHVSSQPWYRAGGGLLGGRRRGGRLPGVWPPMGVTSWRLASQRMAT
jgi:hypothetical protein